ncbi:MAG: peptidoglycan DD-metalloendopeptidase family protein [Bacteroidota bacterium]|nr:peptidoglycan DD-metalloendopeptidase family protein [Bacteroidota bacterium]
MNLKYILAGVLSMTLAVGHVCAQDTIKMSKKEAEIKIPRPHLMPVRSLMEDRGNVLDTIVTQSPGVKIILFDNNTWKYYRDPEVAQQQAVFTTNWNTEVPNPFRTSVSELPDKISIWVVDSLSSYKCPNSVKVYSRFGFRHRRRHQGVDLPLHTGDPIYAAFSGKVRMSRYNRGYGNLVVIRHENGLETFYAHLSKRNVEVGDWVEAGDVIGLGGSTGRSTGPHLHFETRYQGYAFDPEWLIDFEKGELRHRLFVLHRRYLSDNSRYVPETEDDEYEIHVGDEKAYAVADSIQAVREAEAERAAAEAAAAKYHKVRSGDTLYGLARKYGTSVNAICRLNSGMTAKSTLRVGKTIRVR